MNAGRAGDLQNLRILHVFRAPLGGLFRHVVDLATEQAARGHEVGIVCDSFTGGEQAVAALARLSPSLKLGVHRRPMHRNPHPADFAALADVMRVVGRAKPDVIHGHGSKGGLYARLPAFLPGASCPVRAYTPHGGSFNFKPGAVTHHLYMTVERLLSARTDVFLFESAYIGDRFNAFVGGTNGLRRVVFNGLGEAEFEPIEPEPNAADFLYVGELRAAKGIDTFLDALALIRTMTGATPRAILVGSGPDRELLSAQAERLGISDSIAFAGVLPARKAFALGRMLVVPSRAESLPYVVLEAAGARIPMVATNVGGIPEIFGPYGSRLGPCDNPADLAARMMQMMRRDKAELARQADLLAAFVAEEFSIRRMVDSVIDGYRDARAQRGANARDATRAMAPSNA
jgi:glycosyltransferase involved in cell wall biosynthesis